MGQLFSIATASSTSIIVCGSNNRLMAPTCTFLLNIASASSLPLLLLALEVLTPWQTQPQPPGGAGRGFPGRAGPCIPASQLFPEHPLAWSWSSAGWRPDSAVGDAQGATAMAGRGRGEGPPPSWDVDLHRLGEEEKRCLQSSCCRRRCKAPRAVQRATQGAPGNRREQEQAENTEVWYGGERETGSSPFLQGTLGKEVRRVAGMEAVLVGITLVTHWACESPCLPQ